MGVIVYMMLSGEAPFDGGTGEDDDIMRQVASGATASFKGPKWAQISKEACDSDRARGDGGPLLVSVLSSASPVAQLLLRFIALI